MRQASNHSEDAWCSETEGAESQFTLCRRISDLSGCLRGCLQFVKWRSFVLRGDRLCIFEAGAERDIRKRLFEAVKDLRVF